MKRSELLEEVLMGKTCVISNVAFETLCKRAILEVLLGVYPGRSFSGLTRHSCLSFHSLYSFSSNDWSF